MKRKKGRNPAPVSFGTKEPKLNSKKRRMMQTSEVRTFGVSVSASNLMGQLYALGFIGDREEIVEIGFAKHMGGEIQWLGNTVPVYLKLKEVNKSADNASA
jgi:hypothetical protein